MQFLRLAERMVPRLPRRLASVRSISSLTRTSLLRPTWQSIQQPRYPAFSTSSIRRDPAGECTSQPFAFGRLLLIHAQRTKFYLKSSITRGNWKSKPETRASCLQSSKNSHRTVRGRLWTSLAPMMWSSQENSEMKSTGDPNPSDARTLTSPESRSSSPSRTCLTMKRKQTSSTRIMH